MNEAQVVSVDAMGGDHAPDMVIGGLRLVHRDFPDVKFLLFGDEKKIAPLLAKDEGLKASCEIRHTDDVVSNEMKPSQAVRSSRKSSMWQSIEAVAKGEASAIVSAGNTGALMAMSKLILRTLPGIHRPAIAGLLPTRKGLCVVLDLGGNTGCDASNLVEFAIMGEIFARAIFGIVKPKVGLLNIGSEEMKGREEIREAAKIIRESSLDLDLYGFVEGHDIGSGTVDVVVTDGFTGNVALKAIEGTAKLFSFFVKNAFKENIFSKLGYLLARSSMTKMREKMDPRHYNGAMFVGLNGIAMKSHGGTDAVGFANAIRSTIFVMRHSFNDKIRQELEHVVLPKNGNSNNAASKE